MAKRKVLPNPSFTKPSLAVRGTLSPAWAWRLAVGPSLTRTLGLTESSHGAAPNSSPESAGSPPTHTCHLWCDEGTD